MMAHKKLKLELAGALHLGVIPSPEGSRQEIAQENEENMDDLQLHATT